MLIPTENRKAIYTHLFKEGVLVAKKNFNAPKHTELDVPNLQVIKACVSLKSRGYVTEQFSWQYYYFFLNDEGVEYLRQYLHLPAEIVPATQKKAPATRARQDDGSNTRDIRQSEEYRRRSDKKEGATGDFKPEFRAGFGRGRAPANQ
jgi:small subunit ribosomal protein S10e